MRDPTDPGKPPTRPESRLQRRKRLRVVRADPGRKLAACILLAYAESPQEVRNKVDVAIAKRRAWEQRER